MYHDSYAEGQEWHIYGLVSFPAQRTLQLNMNLRRGVPLIAEGLVDCGASEELASAYICICAPSSIFHQTPELNPTQELAVAAPYIS